MTTTRDASTRTGRRKFLGALGAGAIAPMVLTPGRRARAQTPEAALERLLRGRHVIRPDRFGRLFPNLPPFAVSSAGLDAALRELGRQGGLMDAKDALNAKENTADTAAFLIANPGDNRDNPTHTAGVTFFGQFLDHDLTFDLNSRLGVPAVPEESPNQRTPALDLDSVYGGG